jgi:type I restriction enzyme S subunit
VIDDYLFDGDYVLLAEDGGHFDDRRRGVAYRANGKFWVNNHAHIVGPLGGMEASFLVLLLNSIDWMPYVSGTTRLKLTQGKMAEATLPIPPLNEQQRIVAKIEELTARSRQAKEALDAVPPLLDQLRQSILAAAFRGDLTAAWRAAHQGAEPADVLLDKIRSERFAWWKRRKASGYEPAGPLAEGELPEVPPSWRWAAFGECVVESLYGPRFAGSDYGTEGVPTIRTSDMNHRGRVLFDNPPRVTISPERLADLGLEHDDLLVTRTGATIGKCALYDRAMGPALPSAYLIRFRLTQPFVLGRYALLFLLSPFGQERLTGGATATAQPNVNARMISALPFAFPPRLEQEEIVRRVDAALNWVEQVEGRVDQALPGLAHLDEAILGKAFRGELVPQDPNDEPAPVLLERIRFARDSEHGKASSAPRLPRRPDRAIETPGDDDHETEVSPRHPDSAQPVSKDLSEIDPAFLQDELSAALWPLGPLEKDAAVRRVADHLRQAGHVHFERLRADGPLFAQVLNAIESAVKAGRLDRPKRAHVRACKADATTYTPDDWRHALVASLGTDPVDRDDAIRSAAEWARDNLGLEFARLREDGHIVEGLRSALNSAIRRGDILRHDARRISRPTD